jgi:hypothetical protein
MVFSFLDGVYCISLAKNVERRKACLQSLAKVGLDSRVRFFYPPDTVSMYPANMRVKCGDLGCAASHRHCVLDAHRRGWQTVLVIEDDAVLSESFDEIRMVHEVNETRRVDAYCLNLGGCDPSWRAGTANLLVSDMREHTCAVTNMVTTHAIVYNVDRAASEMELFLPSHREVIDSAHQMQTSGAFDQWLSEVPGRMRTGYFPHIVQDARTSDIVSAGHTVNVPDLIEKTYEHIRNQKRT